MTAEQELFLRILRDWVHGRETKFEPEAVDGAKLYDYAKQQNLLGIVYVQCRACLQKETELFQKLYQGFCSDVFYAVNRRSDFKEISQAFSNAGIAFVPMKGEWLAQFYSASELRSMGDIDLVIHTEDRAATNAIMEEFGFQRKIDNHAVWTYSRDVVVYEIHDHMMYDTLANDFDYRGYFDHVWDYVEPEKGSGFRIRPEFHFLYHMTHTAKHIINLGSGIRPFLDMTLWVCKQKLDWDWIIEELRHLQLLDFTRVCFALCEKWFQVEMPFRSENLSEKFVQEVSEKMFLDGLWGFDNPENVIGASTRALKRSQSPYWLTSLDILRRKLFPSYREIQLIPWYSFVDGRPWLLPVAWIYRCFYCIKNKAEHSKRLLTEPYIKKQEIGRRSAFLKEWGL